MTFTSGPAHRSDVHVMIGLAGGTGSGKTFSAMELATGLSGGERFAVVDTENGRALHYAPPEGEAAAEGESFDFECGQLRAPFRPEAYLEAIMHFEAKGFRTIVIDSMSHEHAGEGGLLDWHEEILEKWCGDDWKKRDANTMRAWVEPKMAHKKMVQHLLQVKAHLIFCFRAEEKVEISRENGKTVIKPKEGPTGTQGWLPVCEKNLPFEMTASFLMKADRPGYPIPIKLEAQHRVMFGISTAAGSQPDRRIGRATGAAIAAWARGDKRALQEDRQHRETKEHTGQAPPPAVSLADVVASFKAAADEPSLQAAWSASRGLPNDDRGAATVAYKERLRELKADAAREPGAEG